MSRKRWSITRRITKRRNTLTSTRGSTSSRVICADPPSRKPMERSKPTAVFLQTGKRCRRMSAKTEKGSQAFRKPGMIFPLCIRGTCSCGWTQGLSKSKCSSAIRGTGSCSISASATATTSAITARGGRNATRPCRRGGSMAAGLPVQD